MGETGMILIANLIGKYQRQINVLLVILFLYQLKVLVRWWRFKCWWFNVPDDVVEDQWEEQWDCDEDWH